MIEHVLNDADTIQGLSVMYNVPWQDIVDYNGLEYPYTMTSREAYYTLYASGYLLIRRQLMSLPLTLYSGSLFKTDLDSQGVQKIYELVEDTTLAAGTAEGYFYVRSQLPGSFGNTIAGSIVNGSVRSSVNAGTLTITNPEAFANGKDARVLLTGQTIYINNGTDQESVSIRDSPAESDLKIMPDGDLADDGIGDWAVVTALDTIKQAISHRLVTRRGSLTQHPYYGSRLHEFIGLAQAPYIRKLVELDIHETLAYEERIEDVAVKNVTVQRTSFYISLTITTAGEEVSMGIEVDQTGVTITA
ncbi:contractile injection system sheath initiator [Paenibacillus massiliensis]|uniref:contractile injection system sheath initiator n=1 Tax=Paenibacillus massiliensis TaxID=225917 RepID=UPI00041BE906|nr:DUF2634 domain-containing protein [Paenibacillus massiliensis]